MFGDSWSSQNGEALNRLEGALADDASYAAWNTPEIQDYLDKIGSTVDAEERGKLYAELQQMMYDDPPFIYLYQPKMTGNIINKILMFTNNINSCQGRLTLFYCVITYLRFIRTNSFLRVHSAFHN